MSEVIVCGPAKGTEAKPYRCICCRVATANPEAIMVSLCGPCQSGNPSCARCRRRGVPMDDFRKGGYRKYGDTLRYYNGGARLHRLHHWRGSIAVANCRAEIPRKHIGQGIAVVPSCRFCWPRGFGF